MNTWNKRSLQAEQLDDLHLKGAGLLRTLRELRAINQLIGNTHAICKQVLTLARKIPPPVRILDLGSGGGDILIAIGKQLRRAGLEAVLLGLEGNPYSVEYANDQAAEYPEISFQQSDILHPAFSLPACDLVISSHFLYHFPDDDLIRFFRQQQQQVKYAWIISELQRSLIAYRLFQLTSPLVGISAASRQDGLLAIRRAFTPEELQQIMDRCPFSRYTVDRLWTFRYLITLYADTYAE